MTDQTPDTPEIPDMDMAVTAGLFRRLVAIFYDAFLLLAILMLASGLALMVNGGDPIGHNNLFYTFYMLVVSFLFFAWFWVHGGQTLGLRAWRTKVLRDDGKPLTWRDALLRFLYSFVSLAPAGLGFVWSLFDKDKLAWHDRWSKTRLVLLAKEQKK